MQPLRAGDDVPQGVSGPDSVPRQPDCGLGPDDVGPVRGMVLAQREEVEAGPDDVGTPVFDSLRAAYDAIAPWHCEYLDFPGLGVELPPKSLRELFCELSGTTVNPYPSKRSQDLLALLEDTQKLVPIKAGSAVAIPVPVTLAFKPELEDWTGVRAAWKRVTP